MSAADETLQAAARANTLENFRFTKLMSDPSLKDVVSQRLRQDVYERIQDETPPQP